MKKFRKKHSRIPSEEAVIRMLRRIRPNLADRYIYTLDQVCPDILPKPIRIATLAQFDSGKRGNIAYYPDLHNFDIYDLPNRSLPIPKFLAMFRSYMDPTELDALEKALTNFRLEFYTTVEKWVEVYANEAIDSCMTGCDIIKCYVHPQNKLALAALYAPGGALISRSIVNTDEKWYVRLFGDPLLGDKLREQGYNRLCRAPYAFRMYGYAGPILVPTEVQTPYFDFPLQTQQVLADTFNPQTGLVELIINPGNLP